MNDYYSKDLSRKIKTQLDIKRSNGEYMGGYAPYGYLKSKEHKNRLIIDEVVVDVVKDIYAMRLKGYGYTKIAKILNESNVLAPAEYQKTLYKTRKNDGKKKYWNDTSVRNILTNEIYIGHMVQGKKRPSQYGVRKLIDVPKEQWFIVKNTHEPIISEEVFYKIQQMRKKDISKAKEYSKGIEEKRVLTGLVRCGDCKKAMKLIGGFYRCSTYLYKSKKLCIQKSIKRVNLESIVYKSLKSQFELAVVYKEILNNLKQPILQKQIQKEIFRIKHLEKEINKIKNLKLSIYEDFKSGELTKTEYFDMKNVYENKNQIFTKELKSLNENRTLVEETLTEKNKWLRTVQKFKENNSLTREMAVAFIDNIYVYKDNKVKILFKYADEFEALKDYIEHMKNSNNIMSRGVGHGK